MRVYSPTHGLKMVSSTPGISSISQSLMSSVEEMETETSSKT
jgi:hypothetical protein